MKIIAKINNKSPRAEEWKKVFGTLEIAIHGLLPINMKILGVIRKAYMLDLRALSIDRYERLKTHISEKFEVPIETVELQLHEIGFPILAEDIIINCGDLFFLYGVLRRSNTRPFQM